MSVIVYTDSPDYPVLVFAEGNDYSIDGTDVLHVKSSSAESGKTIIASFRRWASAAIVSDADATSALEGLAKLFPCKRCDDRAARLKDSVDRLSAR